MNSSINKDKSHNSTHTLLARYWPLSAIILATLLFTNTSLCYGFPLSPILKLFEKAAEKSIESGISKGISSSLGKYAAKGLGYGLEKELGSSIGKRLAYGGIEKRIGYGLQKEIGPGVEQRISYGLQKEMGSGLQADLESNIEKRLAYGGIEKRIGFGNTQTDITASLNEGLEPELKAKIAKIQSKTGLEPELKAKIAKIQSKAVATVSKTYEDPQNLYASEASNIESLIDVARPFLNFLVGITVR